MKKILTLIFAATSCILNAQPYLDIAKINYSYSPAGGLNDKKYPLQSNFANINLNLPIELKKGGDAIIFNPFFENNEGRISTVDFHLQSVGFLLGFLKKDIIEGWNMLAGFIVRQNGQVHHTLKDDWQYGALFITTYRKNELLSLKFGIYYNKEFFGNYFIPLAGIDWQINAKDNLFGVLPGNLIFDHKVNVQLHYGISFRALTNSYRLETPDACALGDCSGKNYLRIDDNQLGLFSDFYLSRKIVFTGEIGHTILRRYRFGFKGDKINSKNDERTDNFYARVSLAYRLPLR